MMLPVPIVIAVLAASTSITSVQGATDASKRARTEASRDWKVPPPRDPAHMMPPRPAPGTIGFFMHDWREAYHQLGIAEGAQIATLDKLVAASITVQNGSAILATVDAILSTRRDRLARIANLREAWRTNRFSDDGDVDSVRGYFEHEAEITTEQWRRSGWDSEQAIGRAIKRLRALSVSR